MDPKSVDLRAAMPGAAPKSLNQEGGQTTPRKTSIVQQAAAKFEKQQDEKPPEIPKKPPGLRMSITAGQDRESVAANMYVTFLALEDRGTYIA